MMLTVGKIVIIALIIVVLFKGKDFPRILTELGKGVAGLKKGVKEG